jgi:hypothetical protein
MRGHVAVALAVASMALGAGLVACFDLFHSTDDVLTACQLDAQACREDAARVDAGIDAATDFCTWPESEAVANAQTACAWLGACETPLGRNAFGSCMFAALLAYDCHANPNHGVKGKAHATWDCLWQARSCAAVETCVFPQGRLSCQDGGGPFVTCATQDGGPPNADVRVECSADGGALTGENCALWGQTCGGDLMEGVCAGSAGEPAIACSVEGGSCADTALHWCDNGYDVGIDCADNGAGGCESFSTTTDAGPAAWVACQPQGEGATCQPDPSARCENGVAVSCPTGTVETLDCAALLLQNAQGENGQGCTPGVLAPPFDWTSPCQVAGQDAGEGGNAGDGGNAGEASPCIDSCTSGTTLRGCYRGASFPLDCNKVNLGACQLVPTDLGGMLNAACTPP